VVNLRRRRGLGALSGRIDKGGAEGSYPSLSPLEHQKITVARRSRGARETAEDSIK